MKKSKKLIILIVLVGVVLVSGVSYAYWIISYQQTKTNKVNTGCLSLSLTDEKNDINLQNAYPIVDEEGRKLTPYTFTITNTCDLFASYTVNLEMLEGTTLNSQYVATMVNNEAIAILSELETTDSQITGSTEARVLAKGSLGADDSEEYNLRLWIDEDVTIEDDAMNKKFESKVVVVAEPSTYNPVNQGITALKDAILANEYQTTVDIAKQKIANKTEVDFTKTAPIIDWQESHATSTSSYTAIMVHPEVVGSYNATDATTKIYVGKGYIFDSETGYYTLTGTTLVDPTTLDYSANTYYIIPSHGISVNSNNNTLSAWSSKSGDSIYKINSVTSTEGTGSFSDGTTFKTIIYSITGYKYTQTELESDKSDKGLYTMQDKDGTSYYYRGSVKNNYVKFADAYWRIIRINGDGSIRLLYAGESATASGSSLSIPNATTSQFNTTRNNPAYVGYMYGNTLNTSLEQTNANEVSSTIKEKLDTWYKTYIVDKGYSDYIADSGFCGDRSITSGNGYTTDVTTNYGPRDRYYTTKMPILTCPNESDLYTTTTATEGNKALTYSVGLITLDELMISGLAAGYMNRMSYTYSSQNYWTMSPSYFNVSAATANEFFANSAGVANGSVAGGSGVRAVINLKSDTEITGGIGTSNDPYIIK